LAVPFSAVTTTGMVVVAPAGILMAAEAAPEAVAVPFTLIDAPLPAATAAVMVVVVSVVVTA
jgi:hypothetical protein